MFRPKIDLPGETTRVLVEQIGVVDAKLTTGQAHAALLRYLHAVITTGRRWDPTIAADGRPEQTLNAAGHPITSNPSWRPWRAPRGIETRVWVPGSGRCGGRGLR